uniref:Uncharacterized protein n=1 Tax=Anguilla anguilla TaxID=7936 RepID=A0A0E9WS88_ANGAN
MDPKIFTNADVRGLSAFSSCRLKSPYNTTSSKLIATVSERGILPSHEQS